MTFLFVNRVRPDASPADLADVIPPHIQWLKARMSEGSVTLAGKWGEIGGAVLAEVGSLAAAKEMFEADPLVASGLVDWDVAEFHPLQRP